jgi:PAT family beta-lactamase induction signal transducer AmpG
MKSLLHIFANRRMAALLALGFASGLPLLLTGQTLQLRLADAQVDLGTIGLASLIAWPYTFKFAWAPLMDRYVPPLLGRRRGWLLVTQVILIVAIIVLGTTDPGKSLKMIAVCAMFVAFVSASQDIAGDAYRTDVLPAEERGAGTAVWVMGYRVAMILSGAGALLLVGRGMSWATTYVVIASLLSIGLIATLLAPEPLRAVAAPPTLVDAAVRPLQQFFTRRRGWVVLLFVFLFTLPEVLASNTTGVFLQQIGFSKTEIGTVKQGLGVACTIVGAIVGGGIVARFGVWRSLWVFGVLGAVSNIGFFALAEIGASRTLMLAAVLTESFCAGLVTAGFVAFLMGQCDPRFTATQFALLSSLKGLTGLVGGAPAGYVVEGVGWGKFYLISILAGAPSLALLPLMRQRPEAPDDLDSEESRFEVVTSSK